MSKKVLFILIFGIIYKLVMTSGGNFIFHIDSARDMVDVREMVMLGKPRLTGSNTSIPGVYDGPVWYYLLAVPFIISGGDPYAPVVMQIVFWAIGGYFLLKIISKWSKLLIIPIGFLWIASDYISLSTVYVFNPTPVTLLTPLFVYLLYKYIETERIFFIILTFLLGGIFFNLEMNFAVFIPLIMFLSIFFSKKNLLFKRGDFWIGSFFYLLFLLPQIIFNFKHQNIILNGLIAHLERENVQINLLNRFHNMITSFHNTFLPTILNRKLLSVLLIVFSIPVLSKFFKEKKYKIANISLCLVFVPFFGYIFLPVTVNPWHLGAPMVGSIILAGFVLKKLWDINLAGRLICLILSISIFYFSLFNIFKFFTVDIKLPNMDPSAFKNEIAAIDYVYKHAEGKNFKVYAYLPSVYDYPYQYLFWWYGKKQYRYIPGEYAYSPNKPQYISNKNRFEGRRDNLSGLVFLIKEPDRIYMRQAWENDFAKMEFISKVMVGPLEIEIRRELL